MQAHQASRHRILVKRRQYGKLRTTRCAAGQPADDVLTSFGNLFKPKTTDWSKIKDLEVVLDRQAAPVASDDREMRLIRPLLSGTSLEVEDLRLCYSAVTLGWEHDCFHDCIDGFGPAVVVAWTKGKAICGGYNPFGYDGGGTKASMGAFLFTWPDGDTSKPAAKLPKIKTDNDAILDDIKSGPRFGPGDLRIQLQKGRSEKVASSKLIDYARPPGGQKSLFNTAAGETSKAELVEVRAYVRKGGKVKYELDGFKFKSSLTDDDNSGDGTPPGLFSW